MARVTIYCVQPFWRAGPTKLARGDLRQFTSAETARRVGEASARRVGGAIIYSMAGDPDFEQWEQPKLIAELGDVPDVAF